MIDFAIFASTSGKCTELGTTAAFKTMYMLQSAGCNENTAEKIVRKKKWTI